MRATESVNGAAGPAAADPAAEDAALAELREALFGREQARLEHLHEQVTDPRALADAVAKVLPEAVRLRDARDAHLAESLAPLLEKALHRSVRTNPQPLIDVLFPIIGPAIRKAVVTAIQSMLQAINQALEYALSPRALRWRWEALRTGRPFAEIVLKHSLTYRAEQAFLIHRDSGLLLLHVAEGEAVVRDEEMVSGMLTAIRDFVGDSFAVGGEEGLQTIGVGELTVWVEQSPHVVLALVLRGTPPEALKGQMQAILEEVHRRHGERLRSFDGDAAAFAADADLLRGCLTSAGPKPASTRRLPPRVVIALLGVLAAALVIWAANAARRAAAWADCVARLDREPGIVVLQSGSRGGKHFVRILRDPQAADANDVIAQSALRPADVVVEERPFLSLDPEIVARRRR